MNYNRWCEWNVNPLVRRGYYKLQLLNKETIKRNGGHSGYATIVAIEAAYSNFTNANYHHVFIIREFDLRKKIGVKYEYNFTYMSLLFRFIMYFSNIKNP